MTAVDLFSGCGGFSFGFQEEGFKVLAGIDNNTLALKTFAHNHIGSKALNIDLFEEEAIEQIVDAIAPEQLDVIIAGPPCQGFSLTGTRKESDERNRLFYSVFELAKKTNPKALIIENVPGIIKLYEGKAKNEIYRMCERLGYSCNHQELYAPDFGIPQIRRRVFFVGLKMELGVFEFPQPTHQPENYVTCGEAISDLPSLENDLGTEESEYPSQPLTEYQFMMREKASQLLNHVGTKHTDLVKSVISQVPEGGNHKDLPDGVGDSRKFNEAWTRYHRNRPSKTIDTGHRNHFHYLWNRVPTVRENARLQSFPDHFRILGTRTQQYRQVGNAVPPRLGQVMAKQLMEYLKTR